MVIKAITTERGKKNIIGVDSSSTGIAWCNIYDGDIAGFGKIDLKKQRTMQEKLTVIYKEWSHLLGEIKPEHIFIEKSIFVKNPATARTLSYVVGSLMAIALGNDYVATDVEPATWKSYLGYKNLSSKFVVEAKIKLGTTEGKKFCDRLRKSQTANIVKHNFPEHEFPDDHDIMDACGIALYGFEQVGRSLDLEISKDISIDSEELSRLGLKL